MNSIAIHFSVFRFLIEFSRLRKISCFFSERIHFGESLVDIGIFARRVQHSPHGLSVCHRSETAYKPGLPHSFPIIRVSVFLEGFASFVNCFQGGICEFGDNLFYAFFYGFLCDPCEALFSNASRYIIEIARSGKFAKAAKHLFGCHFNRTTRQAISKTGIIPGTVFVCLLGGVTGGACPQGCEACHLRNGGGRTGSARCYRNRYGRKHLTYAARYTLYDTAVFCV